jgi:2-polyprenyl-6-methoxyphenol hydroxylase-like FAD-dependent oxidoreductase
VFFVGDSAGHCLPLTAEGIRPAFYFALALGRELRHVLAGRATREQALERYSAFSAQHAWIFTCLLAAVGATTSSFALRAAVRAVGLPVIGRWAFQHYSRSPRRSSLSAAGSTRCRHQQRARRYAWRRARGSRSRRLEAVDQHASV